MLWAAGLLPSLEHDRVAQHRREPARRAASGGAGADRRRSSRASTPACAPTPRSPALSGRFLFAVDDGSGIGRPRADVTLRAEPGGVPARRWPGGATDLFGERRARLCAAARAFLALARRRVAASAAHAPAVAARLGGRLGARPRVARARRSALGVLTQRDGRRAVTVLPPLGRLDPPLLDALARARPRACGSRPRRTLTFVDLRRAVLALDGFVAAEDSGWWGLTACAGLGACARARLDVRAAAAARAARARPGRPDRALGGLRARLRAAAGRAASRACA